MHLQVALNSADRSRLTSPCNQNTDPVQPLPFNAAKDWSASRAPRLPVVRGSVLVAKLVCKAVVAGSRVPSFCYEL